MFFECAFISRKHRFLPFRGSSQSLRATATQNTFNISAAQTQQAGKPQSFQTALIIPSPLRLPAPLPAVSHQLVSPASSQKPCDCCPELRWAPGKLGSGVRRKAPSIILSAEPTPAASQQALLLYKLLTFQEKAAHQVAQIKAQEDAAGLGMVCKKADTTESCLS